MKSKVCWILLGVALSLQAGEMLAQESSATGQSVALLREPLAQGEAVIWYLGNDGFAVKTANHFLVFDPPDTGMENSYNLPESADSLSSGVINPQTIRDLDIVVFTSSMADEHYRTGIWPWKRYIKDNITYVFGWDPVINQDNHEYIYMRPRDEISVGDIEVTAIQANTVGAAFLVSVDGLTLLHGGDHVMSDPSMAPSFNRGIDYLAGKSPQVDLLFIDFQVGPGRRPPSIAAGIEYADARLSPRAIFPMGAIDATVPRYLRPDSRATYEHLIDDLIDAAPDDAFRSKIVRTGERGHAFRYRNGAIQNLQR